MNGDYKAFFLFHIKGFLARVEDWIAEILLLKLMPVCSDVNDVKTIGDEGK